MSSPLHASMADVAARAGVSVPTVSRALRGSPLVSPATTARVLAAAEELSFTVSRTASSLATGKLDRIGVLVSGVLGAWFNGFLLDAVYDTLHAAGQELLIYRILGVADRDEFFATLPARRNADALIVASFALTSEQRRRLRDLSMPLVYVNQQVRGSAWVSVDDAAGAAAATRHVLALGHRRLAFLGVESAVGISYSSSRRYSGFVRAAAGAGLAEQDLTVLRVADYADGDTAARLVAAARPTAVVAESDELAMSLLAALPRYGLRVPEKVSVIGFDGHVMAEKFGLSTIVQPLDLLGREAASLALRLAAGLAPERQTRTVPTSLIVRSTTAPPR